MSDRPRNDVLDFVKGSLVLTMVLYHWLNYFVGLDWGGYRYLRFLTPSFIFITGFLVSYVYLQRYRDDSRAVHRRLLWRGAKLLILFVLLNGLGNLVFGRQGGDFDTWTEKVYHIFVRGDGAAAFNVLIPFGYFLVAASLVLAVAGRFNAGVFWVVAGVLVGVAVAVESAGMSNSHLEMLAVAFTGMAAGGARHQSFRFLWEKPVPVVVGYVVYLLALMRWDVIFILQLAGVLLTLRLIYMAGTWWGVRGALQTIIVELGKYSLFAYITQIAVLQVLRRGLRGLELSGAELAMSLALGVIATAVAVLTVGAVRSRSAVVNRVYTSVFA